MRSGTSLRVLLAAALVTSSVGHAQSVARFPEAGSEAKSEAPPPKEAAPPAAPPFRPLGLSRSGAEELADRGRRLEEAQRFTEAIAAYSESIRLDPSRGQTLLALGRLRARVGDPTEAELLLSTAARHRDVAAEALTERAHLRRAEGREAEAVRDLEAAAELSPDETARAEELAALYVARGAWLPALSLWRRAAAAGRKPDEERRTKLELRALTVLAAELDPALAGRGRGYSWTRRVLARLASQ